MTPEQFIKTISIFNELSDEYIRKNNISVRKFAEVIKENASDVGKWRAGKKNLTIRVIVTLCRMFNVRPHDLNPVAFPEDLIFLFPHDTKKLSKKDFKRDGRKKVK